MNIRRGGAAVLAALIILPLSPAPAAAETYGYTGIISSEAGEPIPGACVAVHRTETDVAGEFCADAEGRYLITGLPSSDTGYKLRLHAPGYRTEWHLDEPDYLNGDNIGIPQSHLVELNQTLGVGAGTIAGRITDEHGDPSDATVHVSGVDTYYEAIAYTWDLGDGRYSLGNVPPGQYKIFISDNYHPIQWAPQKENRDEAGVYVVTDGAVTTVDEQWLDFGTVEVTVTDASTGAPVPRPCVYIMSNPHRDACGTDGLVRVEDVPPGWWELTVSGHPSYFPMNEGLYVEVVRGEVARRSYQLAPAAAITTTVVDAATGDPVSGICVHLAAPKWGGQSAHMPQHCSDSDGRLDIGPFSSGGPVQLYAWQSRNPYNPPEVLYGAQWVTADGGSGDQREALTVELKPETTVTIPPIRVDPPGAISGVVRDKTTGAVVPGICAYPYAFHPGQGLIFGRNCSNAEGRYTITDLGPYRWPVEFTPFNGYAWQWSGDVADRFSATMTQVTPGGTATVDARLAPGGVVAGTVGGGGSTDVGYLWTYNATTGDIASPSFTNIRNGQFSLRGHGSQQVYIEYWLSGKSCFYGTAEQTWPGGPRRRTVATPVAVTAGATTTVAMDLTTTCAPRPEPPLPTPPRRTGR